MPRFSTKSKTEFRRRTREEFVRDYAKLIEFMTSACLHEDTRREILYQAIHMYSGKNRYFDHSHATWISEEAVSRCSPAGRPLSPRTTVREHVVPISISIEALWNAPRMDSETLKRHFDEASLLCIISTEEDKRLTKAKLKTSMPLGTSAADNPWARYDHPDVNIPRKKLGGEVGD